MNSFESEEGLMTEPAGTKQIIETTEALLRSEESLKRAQHLAHIGSWELDLATNRLTWSDELYRIFEMDPVAFGASYEAFLNVVHPADREAVNAAYADLITHHAPYSSEYRLLFSDGRIKYVREQFETVCDADGKPLRAIGTVQDITERKKAEETLRKLSRTVEQSPVSVIIADTKAIMEYVNPKLSTLTGYTYKEVIGKNPRMFQSGKTPRETYLDLWKTIRAGKEWRGVFVNKKKNGELYWESAIIAPVTDDAVKITHYVAVKQDITDQLIAEDLLKKSEQKLRDITSSLGEGVYVLNEYGKISFMNPEAESLLGWTQAELADKNIHDIIHNRKPDGSPLPWADCPVYKVIKKGERYVSHD